MNIWLDAKQKQQAELEFIKTVDRRCIIDLVLIDSTVFKVLQLLFSVSAHIIPHQRESFGSSRRPVDATGRRKRIDSGQRIAGAFDGA